MNGKQTAEYIRQRDEMVKELRAENTKLRERLEIDPSHSYDGIATRDETIRLQDLEIAELREQRDRLRILVEELRLEVCYTSQYKISTILAEIEGEGK